MPRKRMKYGYEWDDAADAPVPSPRYFTAINFALAGVALAMSFLAAVSFDAEVAAMVRSIGIEPRAAHIIAYGLIVVPVTIAVFAILRLFGLTDRDDD